MIPSNVRGDVREFFLLEEAERRGAHLADGQRASIQAYQSAAKRRLVAASALTDPGDAPAAVLLYREAWGCLARAVLLADDASAAPSSLAPSALWDRVEQALAARNAVAPPELAAVRDVLVMPDPVGVDRLSPDDARALSDRLETAIRWLAQQVEARSKTQLRYARLLRQVGTAVVAVAILAEGLAILLAPKDIALDKPVQGTPAIYETSAEGVVDGVKNGRFGYHSQEADQAFLTIDLQKAYVLSKIAVFGRGECCFDQSIPLVVEVSADGTAFRKIEERTTSFSEAEPWVVKPTGTLARFVRVRVERRGVLVLSEIEVNGKLPK
ncbi:MAG TPA: discoidin domain-containing protein [Polyangiaceae bacterium]|jgi:hypothetical protein|nr:discoidin domain-containing protein [Polyangiaceae bacterium]